MKEYSKSVRHRENHIYIQVFANDEAIIYPVDEKHVLKVSYYTEIDPNLTTLIDDQLVSSDELENAIRTAELKAKNFLDQVEDPEGTDVEKRLKQLGFERDGSGTELPFPNDLEDEY